MKKVTIILPCYNSGKHLAYAIESIRDNTEYSNWELILVCSTSTDKTEEVCDDFAKDNTNIKVIHCPREGITKAINKGIEASDPKSDIYLTQDDVILPNLYGRDWLTILNKYSELDKCGLVSTMAAGGIDTLGCYIQDFHWIGTWSVYIPRSTINKIGLFDEGFSPGPADDVDYTYRVVREGLNIYIAPFWVDHHRMTENFNDTNDLAQKAMKYFKEKWGYELWR